MTRKGTHWSRPSFGQNTVIVYCLNKIWRLSVINKRGLEEKLSYYCNSGIGAFKESFQKVLSKGQVCMWVVLGMTFTNYLKKFAGKGISAMEPLSHSLLLMVAVFFVFSNFSQKRTKHDSEQRYYDNSQNLDVLKNTTWICTHINLINGYI